MSLHRWFNRSAPAGARREVLLSYAPADSDRVVPLVQAFERAGWSTVDGDREGTIDRARCVIVPWSQTSVVSDLVLAEADEGRRRNMLLPVLLDDVQVPPAFQSMQPANLVGWSGGEHPELNALVGAATLFAGLPFQRTDDSASPWPTGMINYARRELNLKIVYYGPASAGVTTSLTHIYGATSPQHRSKMISLGGGAQLAIFFDLLPPNFPRLGGLKVRLHLYSIPTDPELDASRKLVLKGVSGVVFVADSSTSRLVVNRESLEQLRSYLAAYGYSYDEWPVVFQYNKRDLPDALDTESLRSQLNPRGAPEIGTIATTGQGVMDCLRTITTLILLRANNSERSSLEPPAPFVTAESHRTVPASTSPAPAWSPVGIGLLSLFLSILPAGILHAINYGRLGAPKRIRWALVRNLAAAATVFSTALFTDLPNLLFFLLNGLFYFYFRESQRQLYSAHLARGGAKASFGTPIIYSVFGMLGLFLLLGTVAYYLDRP